MKKRKIIIGIGIIATLAAAVVTVLVIRRKNDKNAPKNESIAQTVAGAVSSAVTSGYSPEKFPLKKGMQGNNVWIMQDTLRDIYGYDLSLIDGKFGDKTLAAVRWKFNDPNKTEVTESEWNFHFYKLYAINNNLPTTRA